MTTTDTIRSSPSHQRYLDAGCTMTDEQPGTRHAGGQSMIHYYGPCASCGTIMRDVNEYGYEDCSSSPHVRNGFSPWGPDDPTICCACGHAAYMAAADLTGRKALCPMCGSARDSSFDLSFFEHYPERETDKWYCGCRGWD